jgi:hypothetical protein
MHKKNAYDAYGAGSVLEVKELDPDSIRPSMANVNDPNYHDGGSKITVIGRPGCFAIGTRVLMFDGSVKCVEDIVVGDSVMGDDSTPRDVLNLCSGFERMYRVVFHDNSSVCGEDIVVNENHILALKYKGDSMTTTVKRYLQLPDSIKKDCFWYRTRVEFPHIGVGCDPYVVGSFATKGEMIPVVYKVNSRYVRMKVLAGIIDGLIDVKKSHSVMSLSRTHGILEDDVLYLSRSLGYVPIVKDNIIEIHGDIKNIPTFHEYECQKQSRSRSLETRFDLELLHEDNYVGFTLTGNHLFLLADFSVVHNTGKSFLISSLIYQKRACFPVGLVMSGTEDSNHHYSKMFPSLFVYDELNTEVLKKFINRQKIAKQYLPNPWALVLLDDCTDDPKIFNSKLFQGIYKNGRHWDTLFIMSLQYCMDVRPVIRNNIDGVFILREPGLKSRKTLYENYASIIPTFKLFCTLMDNITSDYTALYINNKVQSNRWEDCVFWFKASPIPPDWKFGSREFWEFNGQRYNEEYEARYDF